MSFEEQAESLSRKEVAALLASHHQLTQRHEKLRRHLDWLKQQLFGSTSERRFVDPDNRQLALGKWKQEDAPGAGVTVAAHHRRGRPQTKKDAEEGDIRFDESVPVEEIRVPHPALDADHEIISEKVT
ncbi:transposase [bacterium]|nr:transposase [bacterium]